ncbi:hypothetical protein D3C72_1226080 [compost metagenome]
MAKQVDLVSSRALTDTFNDQQQLLTTQLSAVERRYLDGKDLGPAAAQRRHDAEPVGIQQQADEAEHTWHQHQWITRGKPLSHGRNPHSVVVRPTLQAL